MLGLPCGEYLTSTQSTVKALLKCSCRPKHHHHDTTPDSNNNTTGRQPLTLNE